MNEHIEQTYASFLEGNTVQIRCYCGCYFSLVCDSCRFKSFKCLKIYLCVIVWFSLFFPFLLFSYQNYCVIMSCKIPPMVAKMNFRKEDKPNVEMNVYHGALKR